MTKGTPQPTDKCAKCGGSYASHDKVFECAWCDYMDSSNEDVFTPIVPSPDSVTPPTELDFLKASNLELERIATIYKKQRDDGAARLEEVTRENERLKLFIKNESARLVESVAEVERYREALTAIANQDFAALLRIRPQGIEHRGGPSDKVTDYELEGSYDDDARYVFPARELLVSAVASDALSRGATEQSTEQ